MPNEEKMIDFTTTLEKLEKFKEQLVSLQAYQTHVDPWFASVYTLVDILIEDKKGTSSG